MTLEQNREKVAVRGRHVSDADGLALEVFEPGDGAVGTTEQTHAAAMGASRELDVEALLKGLEPTQRHADTGVSLVGGDGFEQHLGGVAEVDELDVKVMFFEKSLAVGHYHWCEAYRVEVDRQLESGGRIKLDEVARALGFAAAVGAVVVALLGGPDAARQ